VVQGTILGRIHGSCGPSTSRYTGHRRFVFCRTRARDTATASVTVEVPEAPTLSSCSNGPICFAFDFTSSFHSPLLVSTYECRRKNARDPKVNTVIATKVMRTRAPTIQHKIQNMFPSGFGAGHAAASAAAKIKMDPKLIHVFGANRMTFLTLETLRSSTKLPKAARGLEL
jgi:hypothetical protein